MVAIVILLLLKQFWSVTNFDLHLDLGCENLIHYNNYDKFVYITSRIWNASSDSNCPWNKTLDFDVPKFTLLKVFTVIYLQSPWFFFYNI